MYILGLLLPLKIYGSPYCVVMKADAYTTNGELKLNQAKPKFKSIALLHERYTVNVLF